MKIAEETYRKMIEGTVENNLILEDPESHMITQQGFNWFMFEDDSVLKTSTDDFEPIDWFEFSPPDLVWID